MVFILLVNSGWSRGVPVKDTLLLVTPLCDLAVDSKRSLQAHQVLYLMHTNCLVIIAFGLMPNILILKRFCTMLAMHAAAGMNVHQSLLVEGRLMVSGKLNDK